MDSVSRYEFHKIFDRVSATIDLKGCTNTVAIENALIKVRDKCKLKHKTSRTKARMAEFGAEAEWSDTLIEHDFPGRAILEARRSPRGIIALTLIHGRQEARKRIQAQKKAELRSRLALDLVSRKPEPRRKSTRRRWHREEGLF